MDLFGVISDHLESFKSWGDKISCTINMQRSLSFFCGVSDTMALGRLVYDLGHFWHRKLNLKIKLLHFLTTQHLVHLLTKYNCFLWHCWFWDKNLPNFVSLSWKLDYPYCPSRVYFWLCKSQGRMHAINLLCSMLL